MFGLAFGNGIWLIWQQDLAGKTTTFGWLFGNGVWLRKLAVFGLGGWIYGLGFLAPLIVC